MKLSSFPYPLATHLIGLATMASSIADTAPHGTTMAPQSAVPQSLLDEGEAPELLKPALKAEMALRAFLQEHPRWSEEDNGPPKVRHLGNQTMDAYLRVVWTGNAPSEVAAKALWHAHQVALLCGTPDRAKDFARDLVRAHPRSPLASDALRFLQTKTASHETSRPN